MTRPATANFVPALGYRWLTPCYDAVVAATTRERHVKDALIAQAHITPGQTVLDLATGTGTLAIRIKYAVPHADVTAADGDPSILHTALRKAHEAGLALRFDCALSWALPYPDDTFDKVVSSLFFHHLSWSDKLRSAREVHRVLKPGGELHVADWGRAGNGLMRVLFLFVQILDGFANTRDNVHGRLGDVWRISGFESSEVHGPINTAFGSLWLYRATKSLAADAATRRTALHPSPDQTA